MSEAAGVRRILHILAAHSVLPPSDVLPSNDEGFHALLSDLSRGEASTHARIVREIAAEVGVPAEEIARRAEFLLACLVLPASGNHYEVLGVSPNASSEEIRKRWAVLIHRYHPDHFGGKGGWIDNQARRLIDAYQTLKDPTLRRGYDAQLTAPPWEIAPPPRVPSEPGLLQRLPLRWAPVGIVAVGVIVVAWLAARPMPAPLQRAALPPTATPSDRAGKSPTPLPETLKPEPAAEAVVRPSLPAPKPKAAARPEPSHPPPPRPEAPAPARTEGAAPASKASAPQSAPIARPPARQVAALAEAPPKSSPPSASTSTPASPLAGGGETSPKVPVPGPSPAPPRPSGSETPTPVEPSPASSTSAPGPSRREPAPRITVRLPAEPSWPVSSPPAAPAAPSVAPAPPPATAVTLSSEQVPAPTGSGAVSPDAARTASAPRAPAAVVQPPRPAPSASGLTHEPADAQGEGLAVVEAFRSAYERKDLPALMGLFGASPREKDTTGRVAVQQLYARNFSRLGAITYELSQLEVAPRQTDGAMHVQGRFRIRATLLGPPGNPLDRAGQVRLTLRREGGTLRIVAVDYDLTSP